VGPARSVPGPVARWHAIAETGDLTALDDLLADDVFFRSPAVHTPQLGRDLTRAYLTAAMVVLGPTLRYVREWYGERSAVLEFEAVLDGLSVHGIDMFVWDDDERLIEFTVMVRPMRGLQKVIELMAAQLAVMVEDQSGAQQSP
jgi:hypothetical protein